MEEKRITYYCYYCMIEGAVIPATKAWYNPVDALSIPLCPECYEVEMNTPVVFNFWRN